MPQDFMSTAKIQVLEQRARIIALVRKFFDERGFFEVETPLISQDVVVDRHLHPIAIDGDALGASATAGKTYWLQTSPEFSMKRLLACGAKAIYQICHAFRSGEAGNLHNPEFTMLEWYRVGDGMDDGMKLLAELVTTILKTQPCQFLTYQAAFDRIAGVDILNTTANELENVARRFSLDVDSFQQCTDLDTWRNLLLSQVVEPQLGRQCPEIVYDWPASQAALAVVRDDQPPVAERFELYYRGLELANGYHELLDAEELRNRIVAVNNQREQDGNQKLPAESRLLEAMRSGLPACSGVALGMDRLVMLATGASAISEVIAFPIQSA